jgi:hypothetical protein
MFGFLKISENTIYVPNDLTFKNSRIQHKETINIDDIIAIEFLEEECTSNGSKISWRYTGMPSYLKLIMKDESIKRIYLGCKISDEDKKYIEEHSNGIDIVEMKASKKEFKIFS